MPITLPTKPSPPITTAPNSLVLYGQAKVGKTYALTQLKNCLIIGLEKGTDAHECMKVEVGSFTEFIATCKQIVAEGKKYTYVAIDTVDALENLCHAEATVMYKSSNVGRNFTGKDVVADLEQGAGYLWLRKAFDLALVAAMSTARHVIFTCHVRDSILAVPGQAGVIIKDLDLTGKCRNMVASRCDAIGHLTRRKNAVTKLEDCIVSFKTSDDLMVGCRQPYLAGKEFVFIDGADRTVKWDTIYPTVILKA